MGYTPFSGSERTQAKAGDAYRFQAAGDGVYAVNPHFPIATLFLTPASPVYFPVRPGTIPSSLCHRGRDSSIVFLFLGYNQLSGSLKVSLCGSLSFIDVTVRRTMGSHHDLQFDASNCNVYM